MMHLYLSMRHIFFEFRRDSDAERNPCGVSTIVFVFSTTMVSPCRLCSFVPNMLQIVPKLWISLALCCTPHRICSSICSYYVPQVPAMQHRPANCWSCAVCSLCDVSISTVLDIFLRHYPKWHPRYSWKPPYAAGMYSCTDAHARVGPNDTI